MREKIVRVPLGDRRYNVYIGYENITNCGRYLAAMQNISSVMIITDKNVAIHYLEIVSRDIEKKGIPVRTFILQPGERSKTISTASRIYTKLILDGFDSYGVIVALGGGVVADLAGFVAATYLRGIRFCQVPTTLLAQTDASVGGKVAVNHKLGKNLVGTFYQPAFVLSDTSMLNTLPRLQWKNGMAEVIKYAIIEDSRLFKILENYRLDKIRCSPEIVSKIVYRCCKIKAGIVAKDEKDKKSIRMILNFGHTIGHALEKIGDPIKLSHGEAIATGMIAASYISWRLGVLAKPEMNRIVNLILKFGLAKKLPAMDFNEFVDYLYRDKKRMDKTLRFVLINKIGTTCYVDGVTNSLIRESLNYTWEK